jgi:2-aminoadipate transaminase
VARLRSLYGERLAVMDAALRAIFGSQVAWTRPGGGFFLWITLPAALDAERLFPSALAEGVAFVPGAAFSNSGQFHNAARLCFAYPTTRDIEIGLRRLKTAIDKFQSQETKR